MHIEVLSLFPEYIKGPLRESILKRAIDRGILRVSHHNIRDFSDRKDRRVDDRPFGGGPGMVLSPGPVIRAIQSFAASDSTVVYLTPQGAPLTAALARELSQSSHLVVLCGHYEGVDQRAIDITVHREISIGDYVLTNGCLAALVLIDVVARFIPGVLGDERASAQDSFEGGLLDCPHYTHPVLFEGHEVPHVLLSGDHERIRQWRDVQATLKTINVRPDLLGKGSPGGASGPRCERICISTSSFEAVVSWYRAVLGVEPHINGRTAFFCCGDVQLMFVPGMPSCSSGADMQIPLISFVISEWHLSEVRSFAERRRCLIGSVPESETELYIKDPEGRVVCIYTSPGSRIGFRA